MKILVGVDESPHSKAALQWVKQMQWPEGTRVLVVSAVAPVIPVYSEIYVPAVPLTDELLKGQLEFHRQLVSRAEKELEGTRLATASRVLQGDARDVLVETAKSEAIDLLVVGSHGMSGLARLLLGSVSSHVVAHAPCSVVVVKTGSRGA